MSQYNDSGLSGSMTDSTGEHDLSQYTESPQPTTWAWKLAMAVVAVAVILVVMSLMLPGEGFVSGVLDTAGGFIGITSTMPSTAYDPYSVSHAGVSRG